MQEQPKIGEFLIGNEGRDAIHIAIAPVVAGEDLESGRDIEFSEEGNPVVVSAFIGEGIGIVDPYLPRNVKKGERFYMFLYPNTVTSLRHVWTHPAFKIKVPELKEAVK
jgi:hypothetical protein